MAKKTSARSVAPAGAALGKALSPRELHALMAALNDYEAKAPAALRTAVRTAGAKLRAAHAAKVRDRG